jgi:hypothetical protein
MANVLVAETSLQGIANAIREKNGTEDTYRPSEMPQAILDIEGGGGVDNLKYVKTVTFSDSISEITEPIFLDLSNATSLVGAFSPIPINSPKISIKVSDLCTNFGSAFRYNTDSDGMKELEIIGDTSNITDYSRMFYARKTIETIKGELDFSKCTNVLNMFYNCLALREVTPKAGTIKLSISFSSSPNLTNESKQAIFDGLSTVETTQTLTLNNQVKILQSQVDSANTKGWTVAGGTVVSEEEYYG